MALHRKRHRFEAGLPEYAGLLVIVLTLGTGIQWWIEMDKSDWPKVPARIIGVKVGGGEGTPSTGLALAYVYEAQGQRYSGTWRGNIVSAPLAKASIPSGALELLREDGLVNFRDSDQNIKNVLDSVTVTDKGKEAARKRGYTVEQIRKRVRDGEMPADAAAVFELESRSQTGPAAQGKEPDSAGGMRQEAPRDEPENVVQSEHVTGKVAIGTPGVDGAVTVRYDPRNPSLSLVNYPGFGVRLPYLLAFLSAAALTLGYFGQVYPTLKKWGY